MGDIVNLMDLEVNVPTDNFGEYCTSLSAPPKWGKTEWAIKYDKPFILDFEEGSKGKVVLRVSVSKWTEVKKYIRQLVSEPALKEKVQTVVFDTVNYALEACKQYVMDDYQSKNTDKVIDTFNKIPYGGGWELLFKEFKGEINKLKRAGYGVVLISHVKTKEFEKKSESAHFKTVPDLTDKERNLITAMADFMLLGEFETEIIIPAKLDNEGKIIEEAVTETKRVVYLRTNNHAEAGFRWQNCPEKIPADFELFQKIFKEALLKEIETGKKKYQLSDEKANKIRQELEGIKQREQEQATKEEKEKQETEKTKDKIKEIVEQIKIEANKKTKEFDIDKKELVKIFTNRKLQFDTVEEALKNLEIIKNFKM